MPKNLWIIALLLALLVSACGGSSSEADNRASSTSDLQLSGISSSLTVEENRFVLALWDGPNRVADARDVQLALRDMEAAGQPVVWEGEMTPYTDYEIPYWVAYPEFTHPGTWLLDVTVTQADGSPFNGTLATTVWEEPQGVPVGAAAPPSETRTWDDQGDLGAITSAEDPNPAFYQQTIAQALQSGQPLLVAFTTPRFCTSKICAPVMDTVTPLAEKYAGQMTTIHVEVIADFDTLEWVPAMQEWGLISEPWVYIIDQDGLVFARFEGPVAPRELEPVLQDVLAS